MQAPQPPLSPAAQLRALAQASPISRIQIEPAEIRPLPETIEAIRNADLIVLGPGRL